MEFIKSQNVEANFSHLNYLEINSKGVNKLSGIKKCLSINNLSEDFVMAVGDGENDIQMLKEFSLGVAIGNASDSVKKQSASYNI